MLKLKEKTKTLKALIILAIIFFVITLFINYFIFDEKLKAVIRYLFLLFSSFVVLYASFVYYKEREKIKAKDAKAILLAFIGFS
jgi:membrane protease YdiL (CAAX protease family)